MNNVKEITKKIEGAKWQEAITKAYKKKNKETAIEGFRKGTAPYEIYLKKMGIESLYPEAVDEIADDVYKEAFEEAKVIPVIQPLMEITAIDKDSVTFKFTFISKPEVTLGAYKKLGLKRPKAEVTKEEIDAEIVRLQEQMAEIVPKDEDDKAESGDTAVIDFEGFVDGEPLEAGTGENVPLELGSNTFISGFEDGIIGMKTGETKTLKLKFPEDYVADLKGKDVEFKVKVREIKTRLVPEVNEEFYQDLGYEDIKTKEEFTQAVKDELIKQKEAQIEDEYIEQCLEKASLNLKVEINPEIIDEEVHNMIHQFSEQLKMQGIKFEDYVRITGMTHEKLHENMEPEAIKRIKYRYLLEGIAEAEKIDFTESEVDAKAKEMADNYGISIDELIKAYGSKDVVKYDMKMHKALEILKDNN